jgi:hypothetical protein
MAGQVISTRFVLADAKGEALALRLSGVVLNRGEIPIR